MAIKVKGKNGDFQLDEWKVVVGRTKVAIYFWSGRKGLSAPSAIVGDTTEIGELLDKIKVEMVRQAITDKRVSFNPSLNS